MLQHQIEAEAANSEKRTGTTMTTDTDDRKLRLATTAFAAAFVVHNADHARRGLLEIREGVVWAGTIVAMLTAVLLTLVATRHREAPTAAFLIGFAVAVGVSASHLLPDWGPLSDALPGGSVDALTWTAVLGEVVTAAAVGFVGLGMLRSTGFRSRQTVTV